MKKNICLRKKKFKYLIANYLFSTIDLINKRPLTPILKWKLNLKINSDYYMIYCMNNDDVYDYNVIVSVIAYAIYKKNLLAIKLLFLNNIDELENNFFNLQSQCVRNDNFKSLLFINYLIKNRKCEYTDDYLKYYYLTNDKHKRYILLKMATFKNNLYIFIYLYKILRYRIQDKAYPLQKNIELPLLVWIHKKTKIRFSRDYIRHILDKYWGYNEPKSIWIAKKYKIN